MFTKLVAASLRHFSRFRCAEEASMLPVFAFTLIPLVGAVGAAVDFSRAGTTKTSVQGALDAAVLAGALATANRDQAALNAFTANMKTRGSSVVTPTFKVETDGTYSGSVSGIVPAEFMGMLGVTSIAVSATSRAAIVVNPSKPYCVLTLNKVKPASLALSGNSNVQINAPGCTVHVNSTGAPAVEVTGSAAINSGENCFVGSSQTSGNASINPPPAAVCRQITDPFAKYEKPTVGACDHTNYSANGQSNITLQPGVYCGGMSFSGQVNVTFAPGLFIIKDGVLKATGGTFTGDGVTFFLTGSGVAVDISGQASWHLKASSAKPFPGFVFFLDPMGPSGSAAAFSSLSGSAEMYFEGMVYMPGQQLTLSGGSSAYAASPFTSYIADTLKFAGNGGIKINSDPTKTTLPIPTTILAGAGGTVRLVY